MKDRIERGHRTGPKSSMCVTLPAVVLACASAAGHCTAFVACMAISSGITCHQSAMPKSVGYGMAKHIIWLLANPVPYALCSC